MSGETPRSERIVALARPGSLEETIEQTRAAGAGAVVVCHDLEAFLDEISNGGAEALLVEAAALPTNGLDRLQEALESEPPWSDYPLLLVADRTFPVLPHLRDLRGSCSLVVLEKPVAEEVLGGVVAAALRSRRRQYKVRDLMVRLETEERQKDEFLAMLGHELRNPLGVIRTGLALLERAETREDGRRQVHRIERHLGLLSHLVDDLLDLARLSGGRVRLQTAPIDLTRVAAEAVREAAAEAERRGHVINLEAPEETWIEGDEARLDQALCHLLENAMRYTREPGRIEVRVARDDGHAILRITDPGQGIAPDRLEGIFEAFTRLQEVPDGTAGLGLGLPLVREIVDLHEGEVEAASPGIGGGATFTIRLPAIEAPRQDPPPSAREASASDGHHPARPRRVLIVEDLEDAREALAELLRLSGYEVVLAADGPQGVERARESHPDVVLIDIGLPGIDGYEVARRIRAERGGSVRLVAMTGYGQDKDRRAAFAAGFDLHLVKPVEPSRLFDSLAG